tara:strand:- start:170 stop:631 length:462 start_codon:yes stop_codon:yes gene_type:complete
MKKFIKKKIIDKDIYKIFKPEISPKKMLELGVFGGSYFGSKIKEYPKSWLQKAKLSKNFDVNLNRFKVKSGLSREHWMEKGWIFKEDPLGWFQWYCRFSMGRRIPYIDEIQIKRWKNFKRHVIAINKNCEEGDLNCRRKQRQAILQWAYNPFI